MMIRLVWTMWRGSRKLTALTSDITTIPHILASIQRNPAEIFVQLIVVVVLVSSKVSIIHGLLKV